jgi:hypothetical protein
VTDFKAATDRSYKRRWRNLLINKRYQLRFTLFMVGLAALLMVALGVWVMRVANETTTVSMASVRGEACPKVPSFGDGAAREDDDAAPVPSMKLEDPPDGPTDTPSAAAGSSEPMAPSAPQGEPAKPAPEGSAPGSAAGSAGGEGGPVPTDEPRHVTVQIDESSMTLTPSVPADLADRIAAHWTCELRQTATFDRLERGRLRILWAMILTGIALVIGLALYGIKMTHRVAGPLFKVSLYLSKMRAGRFDKVYSLRKGDQLVDFYEHFKHAHGGIVAMQRDDIARLSAVIAAAEAAGAGQDPAVAALRELCARKEKSLE